MLNFLKNVAIWKQPKITICKHLKLIQTMRDVFTVMEIFSATVDYTRRQKNFICVHLKPPLENTCLGIIIEIDLKSHLSC